MIKEPLKLIQTRLKRGNLPEERGNCLATVIACMMDINDPELVFQSQMYFDSGDWVIQLHEWITIQGWEMGRLAEHQYDDSFYFVTGISPRDKSIYHICIYQNGKLWHDPHPSSEGIVTEEYLEFLTPILK